ncbi:hypothetical protein FF125_09370 [Aureibaculum algae]|uniref:Uncharacterized protein n=1 Tax=Aureibaculum algae TaxID=2584122 RepID=A0A5B7TNY0_9FLAO|nr:hypothetical protein [Aureibaculum algae]QCX38629.1 hypothetical protein FF125_09370 [Aureibaculum algae]
MTKTITIAFLLISSLSFAQKADSTKLKELEFIEKFTYAVNSELFNPEKNATTIDTDYKLPWEVSKTYTNEQLKTALDTLIKNATINIKKGMFTHHIVEFNSFFPEFMEDISFDFFKLTIKSNKIEQDNEVLAIQDMGSTGFGSHSSSGFANNTTFSHNWRTISSSFPIKSEIKNEDFSGSIEFESGFVNEYDHIKITKSDIGKTLQLGTYNFTVIDYINNSVVLDFENSDVYSQFSMVNTNDKGQRIRAKEMSFAKQTMSKDMYDMFKSNPEITFEAYKKAVHSRFVVLMEAKMNGASEENIFGKKYVVMSSGSTLDNTYLYMPNYIQKTFTIAYTKDQEVRTPIMPKPVPSEEKIKLYFENESSDGVLLGQDIQLLDEDLKMVETIAEGTFVKIIGKAMYYFNENKKDWSCNGYKYVKIKYNDKEYIVAGPNVFKIEKLDIQPLTEANEIELFTAESRDFLQPLKPEQPSDAMAFCDHLFYAPIIVKTIKNGTYSLITLEKTGEDAKITDAFKEANFFQSGSNYKTYDNIRRIEDGDKGMLFTIKRHQFTYKVLVTKKAKKYSASYIK